MDFIKQFEAYSNMQLLRIIDSPNDYQPEAVEAAKAIISNRRLTEEEIETAKGELDAEKQEKERKENKFKDKVTSVYKSAFDSVNPMNKRNLTAEKTIRNISIFFGAILLLHLFRNHEIRLYLDIFPDWDTSAIFVFLPLLVGVTAIILFYKKKRVSWFLFIIYLIYYAVSAFWMFIMVLSITPSGIGAVDVLLSTFYSPVIYIITFIFYVSIAWVISRKNIRSVYSISKQTMFYTISITALIMIFIIYLIYRKYI